MVKETVIFIIVSIRVKILDSLRLGIYKNFNFHKTIIYQINTKAIHENHTSVCLQYSNHTCSLLYQRILKFEWNFPNKVVKKIIGC